ncbi:S-adenosyl-L-methionine-dependent methyltransferase [Aspergillus uvarum CBS 121591]|uniref:S-adenosyl-L-methionine-dependent methyltransferase n=1 Tax=Aspergillus uvarum CBS 121591 TaxID=1448315 RepID=A0A319BV28_9EURO|nr:S-adenosyl-L-methionine-dependent methyltransferase [Aspergillus uvarum CBS 121591]PYH77546.1 S-adenosyl-L-methionine-dependent methyltransferase [Aspergillus uvarum CBS 121591]
MAWPLSMHEVHPAADFTQQTSTLPLTVPSAISQPAFPGESHDDEAILDSGLEDDFSDYAEELASDTTSLDSEITSYRYENGRRYHAYKDGAYWAPNDDKQNTQLDIAHHMFTLLLDGKLHLAPTGNSIQRALDIGTGTGIWAIDFADEHPSAEVIGTDLSPIQPSFIPPNLQFVIDDASEDWIYPANYFDLIHTRTLYGAIADWPQFYRKALRHLRPGGWFDQLEMSIQFRSEDETLSEDHVLAVWSKTFLEAGEKLGKTFRIAELAAGYMREAGFQNVVEHQYKLPVGPWSRDKRMKSLGMWNLVHCEHGIEGWAMALLTRVMKWTFAEVQVFLAQMRKGLRDPNVHAYFEVVAVYGQKPPHTI